MTVVLDTSVLIDYLRGHPGAAEVVESSRTRHTLAASEISRLEVLVGLRPDEDDRTRSVLSTIEWRALDAEVAERAGELGRTWLPGNKGIDAADLAIAATAILLGARLLTRNVKHFPMFDGLVAPY